MTTQQKTDPIAELKQIMACTLQRELRMDADTAALIASSLYGDIKGAMRGTEIYIRSLPAPHEMDERDAAIRRDYDGTRASRERLQLRWGISRAAFYRIVGATLSHAAL